MSQYWRCAGWKDWLWILWKANAKLPRVMLEAFAWESPFYAGGLLLKWQTNAWQEKALISLFLLLHLYCKLSLIICHLVRSPREPDSPLPHTSCNHLHQCKVSAKHSHTSADREVQLQQHSSRQGNGGWVWKSSEGAYAHHSCLHKTSSIASPLAWFHWPSKRTESWLPHSSALNLLESHHQLHKVLQTLCNVSLSLTVACGTCTLLVVLCGVTGVPFCCSPEELLGCARSHPMPRVPPSRARHSSWAGFENTRWALLAGLWVGKARSQGTWRRRCWGYVEGDHDAWPMPPRIKRVW